MTCKLNADTSDGLKIVSDTSGEIDLQIDASTKVHMASDGKVGIGTTSPAINFETSGSMAVSDTSTASKRLQLDSGASSHTINSANYGSDMMDLNIQAENLIFKTGLIGVVENMRIDSNGHLCVGRTDFSFDNTSGFAVAGSGSNEGQLHCSTAGQECMKLNRKNSNGNGVVFARGSTNIVGTINFDTSSVSYNTSSDYRLKENVNYTFDATTRLKQLKPARFNFKADADKTVDGFLAHEVSSIVPEAVTGEKDGTKDLGTIKDEDNNIIAENVVESAKEDGQTWVKTSTENEYQGIDQSKLVPLLVKTIQELEARITALES
tara:strand:- start:1160 stop:2125 length:966 start_codon:yes stop_codon:yes gene_type:complete